MYCIKCGVKLGDAEKQCPLCGTVPFHPELPHPEGEHLYPSDRNPPQQVSRPGVLIVITTLFLMPLLITLLCDLRLSGTITWSGYVIGALVVGYGAAVLPFWFRKPHPSVFVPSEFLLIGLYLLYINHAVDGDWFLSFALPVTGFTGLLVTAVVTLFRYIRRGRLYIVGGAAIAIGVFMPVMELLINLTFHLPRFAAWSIYPLIALVLLGGMLIFLAICRPARETVERKFFI